MRSPFDRFLRHSTVISSQGALGRDFAVTEETWALSDDPKVTRPRRRLLASRKTASEAADLARDFAKAFKQNGFHKPSRAWWAADEGEFHRYVVHADRRRGAALFIASGLAGVAIAVLHQRNRGRKGKA
jgi:hypothetical protein